MVLVVLVVWVSVGFGWVFGCCSSVWLVGFWFLVALVVCVSMVGFVGGWMVFVT